MYANSAPPGRNDDMLSIIGPCWKTVRELGSPGVSETIHVSFVTSPTIKTARLWSSLNVAKPPPSKSSSDSPEPSDERIRVSNFNCEKFNSE